MSEILAFQPHVSAPTLAKTGCVTQCRWSPYPLAQLPVKLFLERCAFEMLTHTRFESFKRRHQRFGNVAATERPEAAALIRQLTANGRVKKR